MCRRWFYTDVHAIIRVPRYNTTMRQNTVFIDLTALADEEATAMLDAEADAAAEEGPVVHLPPQFALERGNVLMHARVHADESEALIKVVKHYGTSSERTVRSRSYLRKIRGTQVRLRKRKNRHPSIYSGI